MTMTDAYTCELCGTDRGSYAAVMACERDCEDERIAAHKGHVSPRVMRPMRDWLED